MFYGRCQRCDQIRMGGDDCTDNHGSSSIHVDSLPLRPGAQQASADGISEVHPTLPLDPWGKWGAPPSGILSQGIAAIFPS